MRQFNTLISGKICATAVLMGAVTVGCQQSAPQTPYPMNSSTPSTPSVSSMPTADTIPAGATLLSEGSYSSILFKMPDQPGLLYIVDKDAQTVVGRTNAATPGESMTMADLKNVTQALDSTHKFKIYFVPTMATTKPTAP
jgi:hypothetical protein